MGDSRRGEKMGREMEDEGKMVWGKGRERTREWDEGRTWVAVEEGRRWDGRLRMREKGSRARGGRGRGMG